MSRAGERGALAFLGALTLVGAVLWQREGLGLYVAEAFSLCF